MAVLLKASNAESGSKLYIGIDLGATNAKAGVVNDQGDLLGSHQVPLSSGNMSIAESHHPDNVVKLLVECVRSVVKSTDTRWEDVIGIGVGSPGHVYEGVVKAASNFPGWSDVPLASLLQEALSRPVSLVNDADAALLAECWVGTASSITKTNKTVVMMTLGSGVGAAAYCNGSLVVGARGLIEAGHSIVDSSVGNARLCGCGQRGCIEAYASANSVRDRYQEAMNKTSEEKATSTEIFQLASSSDSTNIEVTTAQKVIDETTRLLAVFCINICRFLDPDVILIGGGMAEAGDLLFDGIRSHFQSSRWTVLPDVVEILPASLGRHAGLVGAAAAARN